MVVLLALILVLAVVTSSACRCFPCLLGVRALLRVYNNNDNNNNYYYYCCCYYYDD